MGSRVLDVSPVQVHITLIDATFTSMPPLACHNDAGHEAAKGHAGIDHAIRL